MNFTTKDYESGYGFNTHVWGPMQWSMLHMISFNYPVKPTPEDKENYYSYILNLRNVLPCKSCRDNLKKNLSELGFSKQQLKDRHTFSKFIYDLHNHVNLMLGKQKYLTYEAVRDMFELFRAKCVNGTPLIPVHEKGCIKPLNNIKTQTVIHITPLKAGQESFVIDKKCIPGGSNYAKTAGRQPSNKAKSPRFKSPRKSPKKSQKKSPTKHTRKSKRSSTSPKKYK